MLGADNEIKEDAIGGACSTHEADEKRFQIQSRKA
jgi:hypothetical protein